MRNHVQGGSCLLGDTGKQDPDELCLISPAGSQHAGLCDLCTLSVRLKITVTIVSNGMGSRETKDGQEEMSQGLHGREDCAKVAAWHRRPRSDSQL